MQQRRRQEQQQVREQQQELQQQVREQRQAREGLLFCHKRPEQRPTELPRGVIFSWGISFSRCENISRDATS